MTPNTINVVLAADSAYLSYAGITLASALEGLCVGRSLRAFILCDEVPLAEKERYAQLASSGRFTVEFVTIKRDEHILGHVPANSHWSVAANYRFLIGELLPPDVHKVIYLDCDLFVLGSLHALFDVDLGTNLIGAVEDSGSERHTHLGIRHSTAYFNSGVLVINLDRWREMNAGVVCIKCADENVGIFEFVDQDALNVVFDGKVRFLDPSWNVQVRMYQKYTKYADALRSPRVVHFTTATKPWQAGNAHPWRAAYRHFASETPWSETISSTESLLSRLKMIKRWTMRYALYSLSTCWRAFHSK